jgi:Ca-activated chloride channel family protein
VRQIAAALIVLLVLSASLVAQDPVPQLPPPAPSEEQSPKVFRTGASLVALSVTVSDGRKLVTGLTRDDFEVYEDGVRQQLQFFEATAVPIDVILLLDTSSSMRDKMSTVHDAARGFMKMLRPEDRGAVVAFNDDVRVLQDLTSDASAIESAINATAARGSTSLNNAIYIALKTFGRAAQRAGKVRRQAIAVLSDGEDTSSLITAEDVVALARRTGVSVYTIGLQSQFASARQASARKYLSESEYSLKALAKETGAQSFFPSGVHELKNVYQAIASELESQYSIGYAPTNSRADGRFRRILVRVTADPSFRPRARAGYIAESPRTIAGVSPSGMR